MPELPDVEAQRRTFAAHAQGKRVERVHAPDADIVRNTTPQGLGRGLRGRTFGKPWRHGKYLMAPTGDGPVLVLHFGMTGSLAWAEPGVERHAHDRAAFELGDGELRLRMMRRLGGVWLAEEAAKLDEVTGGLGPDAGDLDEEGLRRALAGGGMLKPTLMNQAKIAGLGNLLADEVLWQARLHPRRPVGDLGDDDWARLSETLRAVLDHAVDAGHVPPEDDWLTGARDDEEPACPRCGTTLATGRVGGRTGYWCPRCQPN